MGKKKHKKKEKIKPSKIPSYYRISCAYHESGHAIASLCVGALFDYILVRKRYTGHCDGEVTYPNGSRVFPINRAIICYCGGIADHKYRNTIAPRSSGGVDADQAFEQINYLHDILLGVRGYHKCRWNLENEILLTSQKLVDDNWDQIDFLAKYILKNKKKMYYYEVIRLLLENNMYDSLVTPPRIKLEPGVCKE